MASSAARASARSSRASARARAAPHSSFARVLELLEEAARAVALPFEEWNGGPCAAEVLWSPQLESAALRGPRLVATVHDVNPLLPDGRPRWQRAWAERKGGGSLMFIDTTMRPTVDELLRGMIVVSGNDASVALAEAVGGTLEQFEGIDRMVPGIGDDVEPDREVHLARLGRGHPGPHHQRELARVLSVQ